MPPTNSLLSTARKELFSLKALTIVIITAFLYSFISVFLLNYRFVLAPGTSFTYKIILLTNLIPGLWTGLSLFDFILFLVTALLVGLNLLLLFKTIIFIKNKGKIKLSIGGATLIALITTGCASCGLSVFSVLGLSASLSFLPFRGLELHIISILFLLFSFIYMFWQLHQVKYCKLK